MAKRIKVLIIEDSKDDAELLVGRLENAGYEVTSDLAQTADETRALLTKNRYDVVVSDHKMPGFDAIEAHDIMRGAGLDAPFIIFSNVIGEELAVEAMRAGANDFVMKNNPSRLVPAIEREIREAQSRREKRAVEEKFKITQSLLQKVFESPLIGLHFNDDKGHVIEANEVFLKMVGFDRRDLAAGRLSWDFLVPKEYVSVNHTQIAEALKDGVSKPVRKEYIRKDSTRVAVLVATAVVEHPVYKFVTYAVDLSLTR